MPKYNSIETIPARVFFEILKTKNYQLLKPKPKEKGLEDVFANIYNDWFKQSDNKEALRYLELNQNILIIEYKIATIKDVLQIVWLNKTTKEMRVEWCKELRKSFGIDIEYKEGMDWDMEVKRVLQVEVGILKNDLNLAKIELEEFEKGNKGEFNFYRNLANLGNYFGRNLDENMSLAMYIELEKLVKKK